MPFPEDDPRPMMSTRSNNFEEFDRFENSRYDPSLRGYESGTRDFEPRGFLPLDSQSQGQRGYERQASFDRQPSYDRQPSFGRQPSDGYDSQAPQGYERQTSFERQASFDRQPSYDRQPSFSRQPSDGYDSQGGPQGYEGQGSRGYESRERSPPQSGMHSPYSEYVEQPAGPMPDR